MFLRKYILQHCPSCGVCDLLSPVVRGLCGCIFIGLVSPVIESLLLSSSPVKDGACCRRCSAYFVLASACFDFLIDASRILLCAVRYCASRKVGHGTRSFSGRFMVTCCVVFHHSELLVGGCFAVEYWIHSLYLKV